MLMIQLIQYALVVHKFSFNFKGWHIMYSGTPNLPMWLFSLEVDKSINNELHFWAR